MSPTGMPMTEFFIGLISGTSMGGIDAALVDGAINRIQPVAIHTHAYSSNWNRPPTWKTRGIVIDGTGHGGQCSLAGRSY